MVNSLSKLPYQKDKFNKLPRECSICLKEFEENVKITPLSCDVRHVFHTDCIVKWMRENNNCPICRAEMNPNELSQFHENLDQRLYDVDKEET